MIPDACLGVFAFHQDLLIQIGELTRPLMQQASEICPVQINVNTTQPASGDSKLSANDVGEGKIPA